MTLQGIKRASYTLNDSPFASGGEGKIYSVVGEPELAAKIWTDSANNHRHAEKIRWMIQTREAEKLEDIAWPQDLLVDGSGNACGFIMRRFNGKILLAHMLSKDDFTWRQRVRLAVNLCAVVQEVHDMGQCIGDMNPLNFGIDTQRGYVFAFDADSFHFKSPNGWIYPCVVGLPEYYPPEIQQLLGGGQSLKTITGRDTFTVQTDRWALAVLIFRLLFHGQHPFGAGTNEAAASAVVYTPAQQILNKISPYFNPLPNTGLPIAAPPLNIIPPSMVEMFRKALMTNSRPTATEWRNALLELDKNETVCSCGHYYWCGQRECPWCRREEDLKNFEQSRRNVSQPPPRPQTVPKPNPTPPSRPKPNPSPPPHPNPSPASPPRSNPAPASPQSAEPVIRKWFTHEKWYLAIQIMFVFCMIISGMNEADAPVILVAMFLCGIVGVFCQCTAPLGQGWGKKEPVGVGILRFTYLFEAGFCFYMACSDEELAPSACIMGFPILLIWWLMYREHKRNEK